MFKLLNGLMDRVVAVIGAFVFSQIPVFMQQYQQQLSGHVSELKFQVEGMRNIAAGSGRTLEQYINKFLQSSDVDFSQQGEIMHGMVQRLHDFSVSFAALSQSTVLNKPAIFVSHLNWKVTQEVYELFTPAIPLTLEEFIYAFFGILTGLLIYAGFVKLFRALFLRNRLAQSDF